jgi:group II intron reverse transcriptase/maturase
VYIEKSDGRKRPLGIPSPKDKIVLKAMSIILEKIYEPTFLGTNHGFRPKRGTHSALESITKWSGVKWFIEGDITACFDSIQHNLLIKSLSKKIKDKQFIDLCWKAIRVNYVEFPNTNIEKRNTIGTPQGSTLSPILANILLHELDVFMDALITESKASGSTTKPNPEYIKIHTKISSKRQPFLSSWRYKPLTEEKKKERLFDILRLEKLRRQLPSTIKSNGYRIYYIRYADDFLVGINGNEIVAKKLKLQIEEFLKSELQLTLNVSKTKITSAITNRAFFLGSYIRAMTSRTNDQPTRKNSVTKTGRKVRGRIPQGYIRCFAPIESIVKKLQEQSICRIVNFRNRQVIPTRKTSWVNLDLVTIIQKYNHLWNGLLNYYSFAYNRAQLNFIQYLILHSAACTIMNKLKLSSRAQVFKKFGKELIVAREDKKKQVKEIKFNYYESLKRLEKFNTGKKDNANIGLPYYTFDYTLRSKRLENAKCVICGVTSNIEMHHRRPLKSSKTDSTLKGVVKNLARKQIPLCKECHIKVHAGSYFGPGIY